VSDYATEPTWAPLRSPHRRIRALHSLCRLLRVQRDPPLTGPCAVGASESDWGDVVAVAVELWLAPSMWCATQRFTGDIAPGIVESLHEYYRVNTLRNLRFQREGVAAVHALNAIGVVPLLLKGGVNLTNGSTQLIGERYMNDLDLAVSTERLDASVEALGEMGYRPWESEPGVHPFEVTLIKPGAPGAIDVHRELGVPPIPSLLLMADAWSAGTGVLFGTAEVRILSPTHQVLYNILHSVVQDMDHLAGAMPLRQLLTLAQLVQLHGDAVDWDAINRTMDAERLSSALRDHLWLAHRLVGMPLPAPRSGGIGERLHEFRATANFGFLGAAHFQRRVLLGFERRRMDTLYGLGNGPLALTKARCRHATHLVRRDRVGVLRGMFEDRR
jgi:hypothetical protein